MKITAILTVMLVSLSMYAQDYYTTTSDLNMRSGAGNNYKSIKILKRGDTIKSLEKLEKFWLKVEYQDKVGYVAKNHIQQVEVLNEVSTGIESKEENESSFSTFLILLLIIVIISILLTKRGQVYRNKSIAMILSMFFGVFGFQKFYLGEKNKGILSILFGWTFIPSLVGLIDFIRIAMIKDNDFQIKYNQNKTIQKPNNKDTYNAKTRRRAITENKEYNSYKESIYLDENLKTKTSSDQSNIIIKEKTKDVDNSIIDVNLENFNLSIEKDNESVPNIEPPSWNHSYIYSHNAIKQATKEQKEYYLYFKKKVLNNDFIDIQGNTNYAFVLYFDFLEEYQNHRNIELLEKQFNLLGEICPRTKNYSLTSLKEELSKRDDSYSIHKLNQLQELNNQFGYGYSDYNPDLYKLGSQYKEKLDLSEQEIRWLNKFYNPTNVFLSIEGCCIAVIKQYCLTLVELEKTKNVTDIEKQITKLIKEKLIRKQDYFDSFESDVYLNIFKKVENSVRRRYGHTRKLAEEGLLHYSSRVQNNFEINLANDVIDILNRIEIKISIPDISTQIALNAQNVNRWKVEFEDLKNNFKKEEQKEFIEGLIKLEESNEKNPNIEHIFFEASKFISKYDKVQALKYYAKYIYYDLKSKKIDNRELTKTVQKSLFKTDEQINDFKIIIKDLIETEDIQVALEKISKIYVPKRKKIKLNHSEIYKVEQKHEGTVELLNGYLGDERDLEENVDIKKSSEENVEIVPAPCIEYNSIFIPEIKMKQVEEELVKMIINNDYGIKQDIVEKYAAENGMFKNQLIDSINENCEEQLEGEILIEEDDENYIIEESYYKEITK